MSTAALLLDADRALEKSRCALFFGSWSRLTSLSLALVACLGVLLIAQPVLACSVCYGDPNSALTKGAQAGVLVLLGVVAVVLTGLGSVLIFWARRAAHLEG